MNITVGRVGASIYCNRQSRLASWGGCCLVAVCLFLFVDWLVKLIPALTIKEEGSLVEKLPSQGPVVGRPVRNFLNY